MVYARGVTAWVEVEGPEGRWVKAKEYKTVNEGAKTSTYIESFEGLRPFREVIIDGVSIEHKLLYKPHDGLSDVVVIAGKSVGHTREAPFSFAKLRTTDQDRLATRDEQVVKGAGSIRVKIHPIRVYGKEDSTYWHFKQPEEHVLHERSNKGCLSHITSFSPAVTIPRFVYWDFDYLDPDRAPEMSFEFLYRSGDLLEARGIKQRPPTSRTTATSTSNSESSGRVGSGAEKGYQEKLDQQVKIKDEKQRNKRGSATSIKVDESDDKSEVARLKAEIARLRKRIKLDISEREVVDLTADGE